MPIENNDNSQVLTLDKIESEQINWLMYPYIARKKLTLLTAEAQVGKTTLIAAIAAAMTQGTNIDNTKLETPINILYLNSKEECESNIKPKLLRFKADLSRIYLLDINMASSKSNNIELKNIITKNNISLIIIDPINEHLEKLKKDIKIKSINIIKQIKKIANETNCAILLVCNADNVYKAQNPYQALNHIDATIIPRIVITLTKDEKNNNVRFITALKNNLAPDNIIHKFILKNGTLKSFCKNNQ